MDLTGINLRGVNLQNATFDYATLDGADLRSNVAMNATFIRAGLNETYFTMLNSIEILCGWWLLWCS